MVKYYTDSEIRKAYRDFDFSSIKEFDDELENFLLARQNYTQNQSDDNMYQMYHSFDLLYTHVKLAWNMGIISEGDFFRLTDMLKMIQEGDD